MISVLGIAILISETEQIRDFEGSFNLIQLAVLLAAVKI